jgi:pteridine reductase
VTDVQDLRGRAALVTGAGKRLGRAFALALASRGADLAIHYGGSRAGAEETAELAGELSVHSVVLQADLSRSEEASSLVHRAAERLGRLDILVNSAALFEPLTFLESTLEAWHRHLAVNLTAPFLLTQSFARHLAGRRGDVVNILDWRALRPGPDHFPYTIAKAGLAAMTQSLAQALAPNVRVNGLALGAILPPSDKGEADPDVLRMVPAARWGTVQEATDALLFLISGPAYVTGEILHLDGGRHTA